MEYTSRSSNVTQVLS